MRRVHELAFESLKRVLTDIEENKTYFNPERMLTFVRLIAATDPQDYYDAMAVLENFKKDSTLKVEPTTGYNLESIVTEMSQPSKRWEPC